MKLDAKDWFAFAGIVLLAAGAGAAYWPLALVVVGVFCLWIGLWRRHGAA